MGKGLMVSPRAFKKVLVSLDNFHSKCGQEEFVKGLSPSMLLLENLMLGPLQKWWKSLCIMLTVQ